MVYKSTNTYREAVLSLHRPAVVTNCCVHLCRLPTASALPGLSRDMVTRPDGTVLNTCSTDALVEMLRFLKRAYWPFGWQSGRGPLAGGFISAATVSCC